MSEPSAAPSTVGNEVGPQCPSLFGRPTPHAPHPTLGGILPITNGRFVKEQTGPDLDERSHSFSMSPNQAICSEKSIVFSPLAAARSLTIRSWPEALDARDLSRACMMASSCDACPYVLYESVLGLVDVEMLADLSPCRPLDGHQRRRRERSHDAAAVKAEDADAECLRVHAFNPSS